VDLGLDGDPPCALGTEPQREHASLDQRVVDRIAESRRRSIDSSKFDGDVLRQLGVGQDTPDL
jgi:hypothetical protein